MLKLSAEQHFGFYTWRVIVKPEIFWWSVSGETAEMLNAKKCESKCVIINFNLKKKKKCKIFKQSKPKSYVSMNILTKKINAMVKYENMN